MLLIFPIVDLIRVNNLNVKIQLIFRFMYVTVTVYSIINVFDHSK
jgi:hypothetical protein